MKLRMLKQAALVLASAATLWIAGCSSSSPNQTTVSVSPAATTVLAGQSTSVTATVNGNTVLTVTWKCTWTTTTTTTDSNRKSDDNYRNWRMRSYQHRLSEVRLGVRRNAECSNLHGASIGELPPASSRDYVDRDVYCRKEQEWQREASSLDSGIRASVTPSTATVPVGLNPAATTKFTQSFLNDNGIDATWLVTQPVAGSTGNPSPTSSSPTCSPSCGSIDQNGVFTAPATVPDEYISGDKYVDFHESGCRVCGRDLEKGHRAVLPWL